MTEQVKVVICHDPEDWLGNLVFGGYWVEVTYPGGASSDTYKRSREKAEAWASKKAQQWKDNPPPKKFDRYTIEVDK